MRRLPPCHTPGPHRPVDRVSWHDARGSCERLVRLTGRPYRLPSASCAAAAGTIRRTSAAAPPAWARPRARGRSFGLRVALTALGCVWGLVPIAKGAVGITGGLGSDGEAPYGHVAVAAGASIGEAVLGHANVPLVAPWPEPHEAHFARQVIVGDPTLRPRPAP